MSPILSKIEFVFLFVILLFWGDFREVKMAETYLLHYFKTGSLLDTDCKIEFEAEPVF